MNSRRTVSDVVADGIHVSLASGTRMTAWGMRASQRRFRPLKLWLFEGLVLRVHNILWLFCVEISSKVSPLCYLSSMKNPPLRGISLS